METSLFCQLSGLPRQIVGQCTLSVLMVLFAFGLIAACHGAESQILRFDTSLGNIDVRLYNSATPLSVQNFLNYVNDNDFDGSFFHRAPKQFRRDDDGNLILDNEGNPIIDTFVVQGGGFTFDTVSGLGNVPTDPPVLNEPGISNRAGTLAYAKLGNNPNSATSGFFFNTVDNSENLDLQNGGFTVFGRIVGGMDVLDAIAALEIRDLDGSASETFDTVPLLDPTPPVELIENLVFLNDVRIRNVNAADYNFNGFIDLGDYQLWKSTFGSTTNAAADGNGNGIVDAADFVIWRDARGGAGSGSGTIIPEPSAIALLLLMASGLFLKARKKR